MSRAAGVGALLVVLVGGAILVASLAALPSAGEAPAPSGWVGHYLWEVRGVDLAAQALLVLVGVLGVLLVLGGPGEDE